jgi:hypothetical protein
VRAELAEEDAKQPPAAGRNTLIQEFDQMIKNSLNLEPIAMFHDLLHLYLDVTSSGLRERKICTIRSSGGGRAG